MVLVQQRGFAALALVSLLAGGTAIAQTGSAAASPAPLVSATHKADSDRSVVAPLKEPVARRRKPLWELGLGGVGVSQLAYPGSAVSIDRFLAVPYFIYRGPVFRVDDGDIAVRALRSSRLELDLGLAAAFGSRNSELPVREGMRGLGTLVEIGPRLSYRFGKLLAARPNNEHPLTLELPARAVFDIDDSFAFRGWSFEPTVQWRHKLGHGFGLRIAASTLLGTRKLTSVFYGVGPDVATAERPEYRASGGLMSSRLGVYLGYNLTRNWRVVTFARLDHVGGAANEDSPLVQRRTGWTTGIGFNWRVLRSSQLAQP